jgi:hypothetical protein
MTNNHQLHKNLISIFEQASGRSFEADLIQLDFRNDADRQKAKSALADLNINADDEWQFKLICREPPLRIYGTSSEFRLSDDFTSESNILIVDYKDGPQSFLGGITYSNFEIAADQFLFTNAHAYIQFLDFLKDQEQYEENIFHFLDSHNRDARLIVLSSLSERGRVIIRYGLDIPTMDPSTDYRPGFQGFSDCFDGNRDLPKFLKNVFVAQALTYPIEVRLVELFKNLESIVGKANVNHEVYINNLSIDNIRKEYDELRKNYFENLASIVAKLTQKVIGLPIGVSATLFTVTKVKEAQFVLCFILVASVVTTVYLVVVLRMHYRDAKYLNDTFEADYSTLSENQFFQNNPAELEAFDKIRSIVRSKVKLLIKLVIGYYWILCVVTIVIVAYIMHLLSVSESGWLWTSTILLFIASYVQVYWVDKE